MLKCLDSLLNFSCRMSFQLRLLEKHILNPPPQMCLSEKCKRQSVSSVPLFTIAWPEPPGKQLCVSINCTAVKFFLYKQPLTPLTESDHNRSKGQVRGKIVWSISKSQWRMAFCPFPDSHKLSQDSTSRKWKESVQFLNYSSSFLFWLSGKSFYFILLF